MQLPSVNENRRNLEGFAVIIILIGLRLLALLFPAARLWGLNHLLFLPREIFIGYIVMGLACAACWFFPSLFITRRLYAPISQFLESENKTVWLGIAILSVPFFWLCRMPDNLLGDGYTVINNIGGSLPAVFKWSESLTVRIVYFISRLLPYDDLRRGEYAYAIVSVLSGGATIYFFISLAYELGSKATERLLVFGSLLFSGWLVLFLGYAENYPILWPFLTGYLYFAIRFLNGKNTLITALIFLAIAMALHLQALFFAISFPFLLASRGVLLTLYRRHKKSIWLLSGILAAGAGVAFMYKYNRDLPFRVNFLPFIQGRPASPDYAIFSISHMADIFNEFTLLFPLWPLFLILGTSRARHLFHDPIDRFLVLFSLGGLVMITIIDPRLGMGRDWDLMALVGLGPALLLLRSGLQNARISPRQYPLILGLSVLLIAPFVLTELSRQPSLNYVQSLLQLDMPKSRSGLVVLRNYYHDQGDTARAESINNSIFVNFPIARQASQIELLIKNRRLAEAQILADSISAADPFSVDAFNIKGSVAFAQNDFSAAVILFEQARRLQPENHKVLINLAKTYQHLRRVDDLWATLRTAQRYAPHDPDVLLGLAATFLSTRQYDSSFIYAVQATKTDTLFIDAYYLAGLSAYSLGKPAEAKLYLTKYLQLEPAGVNRPTAEQLLQRLN
jgi:tetratricopeptide (TPR) repeat protein